MAEAAIDEGGEGTRQRILEAAYTLFYRHGFVRVALELIAAEAGVTKRTLYYHFRSKDDLLAAALELHSGLALARIREWGAELPSDAQAMVEALFTELARWATGPSFEGAGYTRLVMELDDLPGHPARAVAKRHKGTVEAWLAGELSARGVTAPEEAARRIQLLLEGATSLMLIHGDAGYASTAAEVARWTLRKDETISSASPASRASAASAR